MDPYEKNIATLTRKFWGWENADVIKVVTEALSRVGITKKALFDNWPKALSEKQLEPLRAKQQEELVTLKQKTEKMLAKAFGLEEVSLEYFNTRLTVSHPIEKHKTISCLKVAKWVVQRQLFFHFRSVI